MEVKLNLKDKLPVILLIGIIILGAFLRFHEMDKRCLTGDGVLTVDIIYQDSPLAVYEKVVNEFGGDLPFFYILLHFWSKISQSVFWLRSFSALFSVLSILISYKLAKYLFNRNVGLLVAYFTAISPFRILYAQTVRYYSLNAFLNLLALYLFIKAVHGSKISRWIPYVITRAVSVYINYSSFLFYLGEAFFVILYRKKYVISFKRWLFCFIIVVWSPVIPYLIKDFNLLLAGEGFSRVPFHSGWIANFFYFFFAFSLGKTVSPFNFPVVIAGAIAYLFIVGSFVRAFLLNKISRENAVFIIATLLITTILCAISNYNSPRYIIASAALYGIIIALGILAISKKRIIIFLIIIISLLRFYSLYNLYAGEQYHKKEMVDSWEEIASYVKNNSKAGDLVIYNSHAFAYYFNLTKSSAAIAALPEREGGDEVMPDFIKEYLEWHKNSKIIFVDSPLSGMGIERYEGAIILLREWLRNHNFKLDEEKGFNKERRAEEKRKFINRPFPEYRTRVYIYSQK